ncbi:hypothetical protein JMJ35_000421 [Cladonia borealis]|uniref:Uncharacterized protein n=1 Tax=Cladonia borealis TaxID=184061 RepID=A0AA39RBA8_9LECA|nr:hypothetical protein JMJ35_000421 [Cladonia borealis]
MSPNPTIDLTATLTTTTVSLSHASPDSPPISLNLLLRLQNSPKPITIALDPSAFSPKPANFYRSYYHLTSLSTGLHPRQMRVHGLIGGHQTIQDPETELLTLYPDSPPIELSIPLGISASASYTEKKDQGADTLPYLAIAATPLAGLELGERYRVELKDWQGEFPGYAWWWDWGEKKEILEARGVGEGPMTVKVIQSAFSESQLRVRMGEGPVMEVVE